MSSIAYLENSLHSWEKEGFGEFLFMLGRVGFLLAASVAAYAVKRPKTSRLKKPPSESGSANTTAEVEAARKEQDEDSSTRKVDKEEEEEEEEEEEKEAEEVKTISSFINATLPSNGAPDVQFADNDIKDDDDDEKLLPEFESLLLLPLPGETDDSFPLPENEYDVVETADNASEVERLRRLVKELEEREVGLEGELLAYYGLEEELAGLQKQLAMKTEEVEALNTTIRSLQEEVAAGAAAAEELEALRSKNEDLQRQIIQLDAGGGSSGWTTPW